jgi:hypothetical protein
MSQAEEPNMTEEEDQYMDWAVGCADEPEAAPPALAP